jgi:hypothetical protein
MLVLPSSIMRTDRYDQPFCVHFMHTVHRMRKMCGTWTYDSIRLHALLIYTLSCRQKITDIDCWSFLQTSWRSKSSVCHPLAKLGRCNIIFLHLRDSVRVMFAVRCESDTIQATMINLTRTRKQACGRSGSDSRTQHLCVYISSLMWATSSFIGHKTALFM